MEVPMGFGGPHAGFLATKTEYQRKMPGRLIGVGRDTRGEETYRLSLQVFFLCQNCYFEIQT